jgi:DNA-binding NarL/FixJ family response regulator
VTRILIVDPQPAVRAGLTMLFRTEPGLVPVGAAPGGDSALELTERLRPEIVVLEPHLIDGDGLALCRRLRALPHAPRVILYAADDDPALVLLARVAGADGLVDKAADPPDLFEAVRIVGRGGSALPPVSAEQLETAARRVAPEDMALLAMLVDRTPPADAAAALRVDRRRIGRRIERLLGRLRARRPITAA